jgi:hypothetical protein
LDKTGRRLSAHTNPTILQKLVATNYNTII